MRLWNCFTCSSSENEEFRNTRLQLSEGEQKDVLELMWDRKIFIGSRECRVRDLISDPSEPEERPELEFKKAQAEYMRMFVENEVGDYDNKEYPHRKYSKLSAFHVNSKELQKRTDFWFKKWSDARAKLQATEEHRAALDREIELVERQQNEMDQVRSRLCATAKRNCCKVPAFFTKNQQ